MARHREQKQVSCTCEPTGARALGVVGLGVCISSHLFTCAMYSGIVIRRQAVPEALNSCVHALFHSFPSYLVSFESRALSPKSYGCHDHSAVNWESQAAHACVQLSDSLHAVVWVPESGHVRAA